MTEARAYKLVWFVPREALEATRDAVFAAGAGRIGDYERCSWYTAGTGTFFGGEGTEPSIGQAGREERVAELRVETVVPEDRAPRGRRRARAAHPYEEVAFDLYPLVGSREGEALHRRRRARQPRPGRVRLRARGRRRHGARRARREDRHRDEQRRRVPRARSPASSKAVELAVPEVEVVSDSELLVKQMTGVYRVKNEALRELSLEAGRLARRIGNVDVHRGAPGAQRAGRPARERSPRRDRSLGYTGRRHADVAQLARASACHAEGRGFESHHPLLKPPEIGGFLFGRMREMTNFLPNFSQKASRKGSSNAGWWVELDAFSRQREVARNRSGARSGWGAVRVSSCRLWLGSTIGTSYAAATRWSRRGI